jgi:hypothetical protein
LVLSGGLSRCTDRPLYERDEALTRVITRIATACLVAGPITLAPPAAHADEPAPSTVSVGTVTVETYTDGFKKLLSVKTYGPETEGRLLGDDNIGLTPGAAARHLAVWPTAGSGTGGTSSATGCRKVTVNNEHENLLGSTGFWFRTYTEWCWTRSSQVVRDVATGWRFDEADWTYQWGGFINSELRFYDFSADDGHPNSAYLHYRQAKVDNCPVKIGCTGAVYPANTLRSYYNGTWAWQTN